MQMSEQQYVAALNEVLLQPASAPAAQTSSGGHG